MTKAKVTEAVTDYEGNPIKEGQARIDKKLIETLRQHNLPNESIITLLEGELNKDDLTYRALIHTTMNSVEQGEVLTPTDKSKFYEITTKLFASKEPEFTEDQVKTILDRADKILAFPLHIGKLKEFLSNKK